MPRSACLAAVLALGWIGGAAIAGESGPKRSENGQPCTRCDAAPCCCPDTYCKKPLPCVPCVKLGCGCDTYCKKPLPCLPCPVQSCCPDTYCKKPWPDLCRPLDRQFYRCPPCPGQEGQSVARTSKPATPPSAPTETKPPVAPKAKENGAKGKKP